MNVLNPFHRRGQEPLEEIRDAAFHLLRQQTGIDPHDRGDGNRNIREDVGRHLEDREASQQDDEDGHHHEGVGSAQRDENNGVHAAILLG